MAAIDVAITIADFVADPSRTSLALPPISSVQRKNAKKLIEQHPHISCESYGFGSERTLHLFKQNGAVSQGPALNLPESYPALHTSIPDALPQHQDQHSEPEQEIGMHAASELFFGYVKSFNARRGFGFVQCEETALRFAGRDVYLSKDEALAWAMGSDVGMAEAKAVPVHEGDGVLFQVKLSAEGFPQAMCARKGLKLRGVVQTLPSKDKNGSILITDSGCEQDGTRELSDLKHLLGAEAILIWADCRQLCLQPNDEVAFCCTGGKMLQAHLVALRRRRDASATSTRASSVASNRSEEVTSSVTSTSSAIAKWCSDLPIRSEELEVRNTFIHIKESFDNERATQSMPHDMFRQCILAECAGEAVEDCNLGTCHTKLKERREVAPPHVETRAADQLPLSTGALVVIEGLVKCPAFNGLSGIVNGWDNEIKRYSVLIVSASVPGGCQQTKVKPENLRFITKSLD